MSGWIPRRCSAGLAALMAVFLLGACATGGEESDTGEAHRKRVAAPIESAELVVLDTSPYRYGVRIVSGLPSGCAESGNIDLEHRGEIIVVRVWNTMPADDRIPCTMIYRTTRDLVDLGDTLESGRTYHVRINDQRSIRFTAE